MIPQKSNTGVLEVILVLTSVALTCVLHAMTGYRIIVLNLFYLPVALAAFYLGRYRAGVLAFFSVIAASIVTALDLDDFAVYNSPLVIGLSIVVWGSVLGLTALLVGTLSDELSSRMVELHEAYVGVVEVLSRYLHSANSKVRSNRIAELCQDVAVQMRLPQKQIDDVRVAALLQDIENIEITARVIRKAMGDLAEEQKAVGQHTFHGTELVHSLGPVLLGAFPLVTSLAETDPQHSIPGLTPHDNIPLGARIIRTVRAYDALLHGKWSLPGTRPSEVIEDLRRDVEADHDPAILQALQRVVSLRIALDREATAAAAGSEARALAMR